MIQSLIEQAQHCSQMRQQEDEPLIIQEVDDEIAKEEDIETARKS
jgi:hypothetical protein